MVDNNTLRMDLQNIRGSYDSSGTDLSDAQLDVGVYIVRKIYDDIDRDMRKQAATSGMKLGPILYSRPALLEARNIAMTCFDKAAADAALSRLRMIWIFRRKSPEFPQL